MVTVTYYGINLGGHPAKVEDLKECILSLDGYVLDHDTTFMASNKGHIVIIESDFLANIRIDATSLEETIKARDNLNKGIEGLNLE